MNIAAFCVSEMDGQQLFVLDREIVSASIGRGVNLDACRLALSLAAERDIKFQVAGADRVPLGSAESLSDYTPWGTYSAFSGRAVALFESFGVQKDQFTRVWIDVEPSMPAYFFTPTTTVGGVIFEQSQFHSVLPLAPPLPFRPNLIALKQAKSDIAPMFFVDVPGYDQIFPEVFCAMEICEAWIKRGFVGALFRDVEIQATPQ